jgi:outer membrane protein TolC
MLGPRRAAVCLLFLIGGAARLASAQETVLTLRAAVNEALSKNERLVNQKDVGTQADLGLRVARNGFRPKIVPNVLGSFGSTDINSQTYRVDVSQKLTTGTEFKLGVGTATSQIPAGPASGPVDIHFYNADTTISLTQPLLRGFGPSVARRPLDAAELRRHDADRQQILAEQQVAVDVASAYYRVVSQTNFVTVAQKSLDRSRKLREASEAKLGTGLVSQLDVLRAQQLVAQAEIQVFDAQAAVEDARDRLLFLMGHPSGEAFDVDETIPANVDTLTAEDAIALAMTRRLDLQGASADAADADRQIKYTRNQLLPQVDVNLVYTRRETADSFVGSFGLDRFRFATFFAISSPIDRTAQEVDYQNSVIDRDRRYRDLETMRRRIADDVRRAVRDRDRLLRLMTAAETAVTISQRQAEVAQLRYERGLSNNLDVVTAENDLLSAESRRSAAAAEYAVAQLTLRATVGVLNPRSDLAAPRTGTPTDELKP